ncbi:MAG: hypothetical protein ACLFSQ_06570 [Candidatus Zixiibacteriota bacterium]
MAINIKKHHGSVEGVLSAMRQLNLPNLIASQPSRESDIILGIMACRILNPDSKLRLLAGGTIHQFPSS